MHLCCTPFASASRASLRYIATDATIETKYILIVKCIAASHCLHPLLAHLCSSCTLATSFTFLNVLLHVRQAWKLLKKFRIMTIVYYKCIVILHGVHVLSVQLKHICLSLSDSTSLCYNVTCCKRVPFAILFATLCI